MVATTKPKPSNGKAAEAKEEKATEIVLERLKFETVEIPIKGLTPLIPHKWSEKAKRMMLDAQTATTKVKKAKEPKNPEQEFRDSLYLMEDGVTTAMPATAFKACIADAGRFYDGVSMTDLKRMIFVEGAGKDQLVAIDGELTMRDDMVRNQTGVADIRFRGNVWPWHAILVVKYVASKLNAESVFNLLDAGGQTCGIGDWRPGAPKSKTGTFGTFGIDV